MAEIRTTGLQGGDLVTTHQPPETPREWAKRHFDAYKASTPDSSTLVTTWSKQCGITSYKHSQESTATFHARHADDFTAHMVDNPPVPD